MEKLKIALFSLSAFALPFVAFAQGGPQLENFDILANSFNTLVALALPVVVGLALLAFFWGLAKFIFAAGDEEKRESGKKIMFWGIIALFVMVSIWGIVRFLGNALDIEEGGRGVVPTFDPSTGRSI